MQLTELIRISSGDIGSRLPRIPAQNVDDPTVGCAVHHDGGGRALETFCTGELYATPHMIHPGRINLRGKGKPFSEQQTIAQ